MFKPKPLSPWEGKFVLGAGFLAGGAFVYDGHALLSNPYPIYAFVLYSATLCICLQVLVRYFIVTRIFRTENSLGAWATSMLIALLGPLVVHQSLLGRNWFLCVSLFILVGNIKTLYSKRAVQTNIFLSQKQKEMLSRVQVGLLWFQTYMATGMIAVWVATSSVLGNRLAIRWFGVLDFNVWCKGVITSAGLVCLICSGHLAVRVLSWHRPLLRLFPDTVKNPKGGGDPVRSSRRHRQRKTDLEQSSNADQETKHENEKEAA